jgi:hypothetical protein
MDLMSDDAAESMMFSKPADSDGMKPMAASVRKSTLRGRGGTLKWATVF